MSSKHGAILVFGSGPGVGRNVAGLFAERGFEKVILLSRDSTRLAQDAEFVRYARDSATVHQISVDAGNLEHVQQSLAKAKDMLADTPLECVLFNAARTGKSQFFDFSPENLENDLRISIVSLYAVAQWALPRLLESAVSSAITPSLLVTSGMLAKDPFPAMFSLAASKAGQYSLVQSLHKEFEAKGVHCGLIIIGGTVSNESTVTNARNIAKQAWHMFSQPQGQGDLEIVMTDPAYAEHIKNREKRDK